VRDEAGRRARAAYAGESVGVRVHVLGRWRSCPFAPIADALAGAALVLDVGCGHGLLDLYLTARDPGQRVVGVDIDADKLAAGRAAVHRAGLDDRIEMVDVPAGWTPAVEPPARPPAGWPAIVIVDVLYLLGRDATTRILADAAAALAPGGRIVVKELDTEPAWKRRVSTAQEVVATRVLRITKGSELDLVGSARLARTLGELGLDVETVRLDRGRLHPHYLVIARRPEAD
jgi:cyclopropane fatty-acyl-phospholipid synthase-like methyltransferase